MRRLLFLLPLLLLIAACSTTPADNRTRLAQTEISATAAFKEITTLANAGIIKKGSRTAIIIADSELALAAAIRVWRTNPENPQYANAALAALPALLQIISDVKAGKLAVLIYIPAPLAHRYA